MTYQENYEVWKKALAGTEYEQEIADVAKDSETLQDSFYKEMEFGTAGMRGIIGMGTNRMNVFTVKRATQALANNILAHGDPLAGVAIAYDTRKNSDLFARETAGVLCANGINVFMYDTCLLYTSQKITVVRHDQYRSLIAVQVILQPHQRLEIKMVGRLIQNQQFRIHKQQLCDRKPRFFSSRKCRNIGITGFICKAHTLSLIHISVP